MYWMYFKHSVTHIHLHCIHFLRVRNKFVFKLGHISYMATMF